MPHTALMEPMMPLPDFPVKSGKILIHQYAENRKSKTTSKAACHLMEFLNRVFSSEGASRFFKTFLLRFLFDSSNTGDDSLRTPALLAA
jgi:hypothetical protein